MKRCLGSVRLFVLSAALCLLSAGCGDPVASVRHPSGEGGVPVSVVLGGGSGPSRTIAPAHIAQANLRNASFILTGTSDRGGSVSVPAFRLSNGAGTLDLSPGNWQLELVYGTQTVPMLRGVGTVAVADKPASVAITLTPVAAGTGTVNLTVNWNAEDRVLMQSNTRLTRYVRMALYYPGTNTQVSGTDIVYSRNGGTVGVLPNTGLRYYGQTGTTPRPIPAGKYEFRFWMEGGGIPAGVTLTWRDNLYIEPGRETRATVTIPRLAIKPEAPGGFEETCTPPAGSGAYTATLAWQGVYNADSYELEVLRYDTAATTALPTADAAWNTAIGQATSAVYRYTAEVGAAESYANPNHAGVASMRRVSGGLLGGQDTISWVVLRAGTEEFTARMRAVNACGSSAWVYLATPMVP